MTQAAQLIVAGLCGAAAGVHVAMLYRNPLSPSRVDRHGFGASAAKGLAAGAIAALCVVVAAVLIGRQL